MMRIQPVPIPDIARPFSLPMGAGPWCWRWNGVQVEGENGEIHGISLSGTPVLSGLRWPGSGLTGFSALPGRMDGVTGEPTSPRRLTLLFGAPTCLAIHAEGSGVDSLAASFSSHPGVEVREIDIEGSHTRLIVLALEPPGTRQGREAASPRAIPLAAHRFLQRSLEATEGGLSFRAAGIDCGPAFFWAGGIGINDPKADTPLSHLTMSLALGADAPGPEIMKHLLETEPVQGLTALSVVARWRDVPATIRALEGSARAAARSLTDSNVSPAEVSGALLGAAEALEGAGVKSTAVAFRRQAGGEHATPPPPDPRSILQQIEEMAGRWGGAGPEPSGESAAGVSGLAVAVLNHFLVADGDAAFGRLILRPTIPESLEAFEAGGIRLGKSRVGVCYRRGEDQHTFTMEQTVGPLPVTLVLDLGLPGELGEVWIDGEPAEVQMLMRSGGWRIRMQLPLDRLRELRVQAIGARGQSSEGR